MPGATPSRQTADSCGVSDLIMKVALGNSAKVWPVIVRGRISEGLLGFRPDRRRPKGSRTKAATAPDWNRDLHAPMDSPFKK